MLTSREPSSTSLRKFTVSARPPSEAVISTLSIADRKLLARCLTDESECVFYACFRDPDVDARLLAPPPPSPAGTPTRQRRRRNDDSHFDVLAGADSAALTQEQETHLFLRLNLARYRAMTVLRKACGQTLDADVTAELLRWERTAHETRNEIARANIPLVLAMARRTRITGVDLNDLISEGNLALMRSVDKFDCGRGFKFSTYACRAILKSFSRVATRASRYRGYFPTEYDPTLEKGEAVDHKRGDAEGSNELRWILGQNLAQLTDVEQQVIRARFAMEEAHEPSQATRAKTLEQVGEMIGVTKERVRQIQNKALSKLRSMLEDSAVTA